MHESKTNNLTRDRRERAEKWQNDLLAKMKHILHKPKKTQTQEQNPISQHLTQEQNPIENLSQHLTQEQNPIENLSQYLNKVQPNPVDNNKVDAIINYVKLESLTEQNMELIDALFHDVSDSTKAKTLLKLLKKIFELAANLNKTMSEHETNLIMSYPELIHSAEYDDYLKQIQIMNTPTSGDQMGGARRFTQNRSRLHRKGATRKSRKNANVSKPRLP